MSGRLRTRVARVLLCGVPGWARESAKGDLDEEQARLAARRGRACAALLYAREALLLSARYATEWRRGAPGLALRGGRPMTPFASLRNLAGDVRLALRQVGLAPGFWLAATLTLGLAIGFNATIFSLVNAVLFKPLARLDPDRVVRLYARTGDLPAGASFSYFDLQSLKEASSLTHVSGVHLAAPVMAERGSSAAVSAAASSAKASICGCRCSARAPPRMAARGRCRFSRGSQAA